MPLRVTITLHDDGRLQVESPPGSKLEMLGLLEMTKHFMLAQKPEAPRVQPATVIPNLAANGRG